METYEQIMEYLRESDYDLLGDLEEFFSYSNDAYALLGTIIERVSGLDYAEYVEEHILQPAEMDRSTFSLDELDKWNNVTEIYFKNKNEEVVDVPQWPDSHSFCAAGFLRSTVLDLLKYGEIYLGKGEINGERVLSPEAVEDMAEPACHLYDDLHYGYGLMIQPDYEGVTLVEHGGSITGVAAQFGYVPEEGLAGAVLTNLAGVPSNKIWLAGINAMMGLPLEHRRAQYPDYELAPEQLERFTGTYRSGEGTTLKISLEDDQLTAEFGGLEASLRPTAENTLVVEYRGDERPVTFFASGEEDGEFDAAFFGLRVVHRVDEEELEDSE